MSKITLTEAHEIVNSIELTDVFASKVQIKCTEDYLKLYTLKDLKNKIYHAEKQANIDDIRNQLYLLVLEENYYAPQQAVFYYKDAIPQEFKDENQKVYAEIIKDMHVLKNKVKEISDKIYIEVNE